MITKKEFDQIVDELTGKMEYISSKLESLWQHIYSLETNVKDEEMRSILCDLSNRVEGVQFDGYTNPSQFANKMRFNDFYELIESAEKIKELDKLEKLEDFYKSIKSSVEHFKI